MHEVNSSIEIDLGPHSSITVIDHDGLFFDKNSILASIWYYGYINDKEEEARRFENVKEVFHKALKKL